MPPTGCQRCESALQRRPAYRLDNALMSAGRPSLTCGTIDRRRNSTACRCLRPLPLLLLHRHLQPAPLPRPPAAKNRRRTTQDDNARLCIFTCQFVSRTDACSCRTTVDSLLFSQQRRSVWRQHTDSRAGGSETMAVSVRRPTDRPTDRLCVRTGG
jgi:hypothetical protein